MGTHKKLKNYLILCQKYPIGNTSYYWNNVFTFCIESYSVCFEIRFKIYYLGKEFDRKRYCVHGKYSVGNILLCRQNYIVLSFVGIVYLLRNLFSWEIFSWKCILLVTVYGSEQIPILFPEKLFDQIGFWAILYYK